MRTLPGEANQIDAAPSTVADKKINISLVIDFAAPLGPDLK